MKTATLFFWVFLPGFARCVRIAEFGHLAYPLRLQTMTINDQSSLASAVSPDELSGG